ncbi:LytTR family DNA-binding domain-containing protein [Tissierella sp. Yu-01]|uniref:LytR/AlgR family response regulator transcription factor n=1 Tax=Tissierella sp. Yu-01 TaxID=3035694 RepID=UPI00240DEF54|nr:LytTR family DNA-binding domain-containing protein [Tissierella sp. Yu-01]WFA08233.1 LytTR family DNA-binding domain-containing protein [Tissierella sp. Yu-01]
MVKVAICEDDNIFMERLRLKVNSFFRDNQNKVDIDEYNNGEEIVREAKRNGIGYDVIFFDIDMPRLNGIKAARVIREIDNNFILIFLTSLDEEVYKVFELNTFRFIRKSYFDEEIYAVLEDILKRLQENSTRYEFKTKEGTIKLAISEILYFNMVNRRVNIRTLTDTYITTITVFKEIEKVVSSKGFVSIYRGMMVNINFVKRIDKETIELDNGEVLQVSRYKISEVKKAFFTS